MHASSRRIQPPPAEALKFFAWAYDKGGKMAEDLDYVPMPTRSSHLIEKTWAGRNQGRGRQAAVSPTIADIAGRRHRRLPTLPHRAFDATTCVRPRRDRLSRRLQAVRFRESRDAIAPGGDTWPIIALTSRCDGLQPTDTRLRQVLDRLRLRDAIVPPPDPRPPRSSSCSCSAA